MLQHEDAASATSSSFCSDLIDIGPVDLGPPAGVSYEHTELDYYPCDENLFTCADGIIGLWGYDDAGSDNGDADVPWQFQNLLDPDQCLSPMLYEPYESCSKFEFLDQDVEVSQSRQEFGLCLTPPLSARDPSASPEFRARNDSCHRCMEAGCRAKFSMSRELQAHAKSKGHQSYKCSECPSRFRRLDTLARHKATKHQDKGWHHCPMCKDPPSKFKRRDHLLQHMRTCHPGSWVPHAASKTGNTKQHSMDKILHAVKLELEKNDNTVEILHNQLVGENATGAALASSLVKLAKEA